MRKNLFCLLASFCLFQTAYAGSASPFDGFYVGADVGVNQGVFNVNSSAELNIPGVTELIPRQQSYNSTTVAPIGGLTLGYGKTFNRLYLGLRLNGDLSTLQKTSNSHLQENTFGYTQTDQTKAKLSNDYGLLFQPGFLLTPRTLIYGLVGPEGSNLSVSNTTSFIAPVGVGVGAVSSTKRSEVIGIRAGLGFQQYLAHHISIGAEYDFTSYEHERANATGSGVLTGLGFDVPYTLNSASRVSPFTNTLVANIEYHFA
jgi:opacity protein-like surface antigen